MILIAKKGGIEREIIRDLEENIDKIQFGFISINNLNSLVKDMYKIEPNKRDNLSLLQLLNLNGF